MKRNGFLKRTPLKRNVALKRGVPLKRRRNKFGVCPPEERTYNGVEYHSGLEMRYAKRLDLLMQSANPMSRIKSWRHQVPIKLEVNGRLVTTYVCDFLVTHWDGREEFVETKGMETETWKIKERLFRALFPNRMLTIVKECR